MSRHGFTLAELLISLAVLGVIATFTLPKVLQSQQNQREKAITKEIAGMLSEAYAQYKRTNGSAVPGTFGFGQLTPYFNYVKIDSSAARATDNYPQAAGTQACNTGVPCYVLHNGATVRGAVGETFGGTNVNHCFHICIDPDGQATPGTGHAGKGICLMLYHSGRITTRGTVMPASASSLFGSFGPGNYDPDWFDWN